MFDCIRVPSRGFARLKAPQKANRAKVKTMSILLYCSRRLIARCYHTSLYRRPEYGTTRTLRQSIQAEPVPPRIKGLPRTYYQTGQAVYTIIRPVLEISLLDATAGIISHAN